MENKKIKKGDFIEIEYTGRLKDEDKVFDTTRKEEAMAAGLSQEADYKPVVACIGEGFILKKLEEGLEGKTVGKYSFEISAEEGFGKKDAKLLKLVPIKVFKQQDIMPYPGLDVNIDGMYGIVRNVSGGRVIVDFNHPLSGKDLSYEVEVKGMVTDDKRKAESVLKISGLPFNSVSVKEKNAMVVLEQEIPTELTKELEKKLKELVGLKRVDFMAKKKEQKE